MTLFLKDFGSLDPDYQAPAAIKKQIEELEAEKEEAYEIGYKAGWDDAVKAELENQERIGAEFARNLQELSMSFFEARAHIIKSIEPLLREIATKFLPDIAQESVGTLVLEELLPLIEAYADAPVAISVAPGSRVAIERYLSGANKEAFIINEEDTLVDGQAFVKVGPRESHIDLSDVTARIAKAIEALADLNERSLSYG